MGGRGSGRKPATLFIPDLDREPWERQRAENDKSFAAFTIYRDLGGLRTLLTTARHLGKKDGYRRHLESWSRRYGWPSRCGEFDRHRDQIVREEDERIRIEAQAEDTRAALKLTRSIIELCNGDMELWIDKINRFKETQRELKEVGAEQLDPILSPLELKSLADTGLKLQRLVEERPTEIGEQRHEVTINDRRKRLQAAIQDPEVREAMRMVAEKVGE